MIDIPILPRRSFPMQPESGDPEAPAADAGTGVILTPREAMVVNVLTHYWLFHGPDDDITGRVCVRALQDRVKMARLESAS
jgi:hypothetical protein